MLRWFIQDLAKALVLTLIITVVLLWSGVAYLKLTVPEQTATGLEGS